MKDYEQTQLPNIAYTGTKHHTNMELDDQNVTVTNAIGSQNYTKTIGNLQNQSKRSEIPHLLEILEDMAASLNKRTHHTGRTIRTHAWQTCSNVSQRR